MKKEDFLKLEALIKDRARLDDLIAVCDKSANAIDEHKKGARVGSFEYYPTTDELRVIYDAAKMYFKDQKEKTLSEL